MKKQFGTYLKKLRKAKGMSLRAVEAGTGISNSYLCQMENGKKGIPTVKFIIRLARVYGVTVFDFIGKAVTTIDKGE